MTDLAPDLTALTPDDHLQELRRMLLMCDTTIKHPGMYPTTPAGERTLGRLHREAAALRWALDQNAYGVAASEVTT